MPRSIPAVILGRLAIDHAWQGRVPGRALLADVITRLPVEAPMLALDLVKFQKILAPAQEFMWRPVRRGFLACSVIL